MLRAGQRAVAALQSVSAESCLRCFAAQTWPAEVPVPAGVKPFDPAGPLAPQVDALAQGLPPNDPFVKFVTDLKDMKVAVDKIKMENAHRSDEVPPGLVTKQDGSVDEEYYTKTQGFHPDFVKELKAAMQEEAKTHPKPKEDQSWQQCLQTVQPVIDEEQQRLMKQLNDVRANVKQLAEFEERLEDITVDEMLEKYPQLAQEIKDEIEAGVWEPTDAGYKVGANVPATTAAH